MKYASETRLAEIARERAQYDEAQAQLRQEAEVLVIDVKKAELSCQKVLATHSVRLKVTFSELVVQTVEDLRSGDVKPKDRALALASLRAVCDRLYGWDKEPDIHEMERVKNYAINIQLQNTSPEELKRMALAKVSRENGSHETGHKDQSDGTPSLQHEGPPDGLDGQACEEKEAPSLPVKQHDRPSRKVALEGGTPEPDKQVQHLQGNLSASPSATTPRAQFGSPPPSPEQRWKQQLEERARLRAEWRGRRR
jgi:hypothetical protein